MVDSNVQDMSELFSGFTGEAAQEAADALQTQGYFKTSTVGKVYRTRVMPAEPGKQLPWVTVSRHFMQLPGFGAVSFNCPRLMSPKSDPKPCPGCVKAAKLAATGNRTDAKLADDIKAGTRAYCKVIDREHPEKGVQIFETGVTVLRRFASFANPADGIGEDFTHPVTGCDVLIKRFEKNPWYQVDLVRERSRMAETDEQIREWLNASIEMDLDRYMKVLSFDEILAQVQNAQEGAPSGAQQLAPAQAPSGPTAQDSVMDTEVVDYDDIPF